MARDASLEATKRVELELMAVIMVNVFLILIRRN